MGCTLDYYIIYVLLLKVTTKGMDNIKFSKKKKKQIDNIDDNKNIDKIPLL